VDICEFSSIPVDYCAHCTDRWGDEPKGGSREPNNYLEP